MSEDELRVTDAVVVGAGFGGLAAADQLHRAGLSYTILDRGASVGGTWRENRYPGCACDIPSHLYSFSFAGSPDWSRRFSGRAEIHAYLKRVADEREITGHVRFGEEMTEARFDKTDRLWTIRTRKGSSYRARFLVSAVGGLSQPAIPRLEGIERFGGTAFHTAQWPDHFNPTNLRIAVIGTGASTIQLIPEIAKTAAQVDVYQRTPAWIGPKLDSAYSSRALGGMRRLPVLRTLRRAAIYLERELFWLGLNKPGLNAKLETQIRAYLEHQVPDPILRAKLTPDYRVGCKRVLQSNDFYAAMQRENVGLITDGIANATETGLMDRAGNARAYDVIVYGTGFSASDLIGGVTITNAAGEDLRAAWPRGVEAYLGTFIRGFPNFFTILGPNTGLGHNSIIFMLECQAKMIARVISQAKRRRWSLVGVRPEVQERYNDEMQRRLANTVWASGCKSWYQHASGRINTLWPGLTTEFWWRTRRLRLRDLIATPAAV